jgi:hypothetical protein
MGFAFKVVQSNALKGVFAESLCTKSPFWNFGSAAPLRVSLRLTEPSYIFDRGYASKMEQFRHSLIFSLE